MQNYSDILILNFDRILVSKIFYSDRVTCIDTYKYSKMNIKFIKHNGLCKADEEAPFLDKNSRAS